MYPQFCLQHRNYAAPQKKGFISELVENIRSEFAKNKEMKVQCYVYLQFIVVSFSLHCLIRVPSHKYQCIRLKVPFV